MINITSNQLIFDSQKDNTTDNLAVYNAGTSFTLVAIGNAGQTAKVEGSLDGVIFVTVADVTLDQSNVAESTTFDSGWVYLKVTGNARIQIARTNG